MHVCVQGEEYKTRREERVREKAEAEAAELLHAFHPATTTRPLSQTFTQPPTLKQSEIDASVRRLSEWNENKELKLEQARQEEDALKDAQIEEECDFTPKLFTRSFNATLQR